MPIYPLAADAPNVVFDFLDRVVSPRGRAHWVWKFRLDDGGPPSAFYWREPDGRVLGCIGLMRTRLFSGAQDHPAAWFVDWHVLPDGRGVGVGLALLRKAEAAAGILLTLQGSADTREILPRLGWQQSPAPETWVRPLTTGYLAAALERRMPGWLARVLRSAVGAARPLLDCAEPAPPVGVVLHDVDTFSREYDSVWQERATELAPLMARDPAYLNYLCARYPERGYRLQLIALHGGTIGHLISRCDHERSPWQRGRLVDWLWPRSRPDIGAWLLDVLCWQLQRAGADYVECVASRPDLRDLLDRRGFHCRGTLPLWYHRLPPGVPHPDSWHVTFVDCDRAYR